MYTRPGQQGDEELDRMRKERVCTCDHTIYIHAIMESPGHRRCGVRDCDCGDYVKAAR